MLLSFSLLFQVVRASVLLWVGLGSLESSLFRAVKRPDDWRVPGAGREGLNPHKLARFIVFKILKTDLRFTLRITMHQNWSNPPGKKTPLF